MMTQEQKIPVPWWGKLLISLVALLIGLLIIELGMRVAAAVFYRRDETNTWDSSDRSGVVAQLSSSNKQTTRILMVGDSYTYGGLVDPKQTCPAYLERQLNSGNYKGAYRVVNQGVCEYNSYQLLESLPEWLDTHNPDWVIVLVGSANRFYGLDHIPGRDSSFWERATESVASLKVVKLIRILLINLKGKNDLDWARFFRGSEVSQLEHPGGSRFGISASYWRGLGQNDTADNNPLAEVWRIRWDGVVSDAFTLNRKILKEADSEEAKAHALCSLAQLYFEDGEYKRAWCQPVIGPGLANE